jgi:hypothetical protein
MDHNQAHTPIIVELKLLHNRTVVQGDVRHYSWGQKQRARGGVIPDDFLVDEQQTSVPLSAPA